MNFHTPKSHTQSELILDIVQIFFFNCNRKRDVRPGPLCAMHCVSTELEVHVSD